MSKDYKLHVISGTHWDREWRYTAEQSKLRLVDLIDHLIEMMEKDPEFKYFLLDGGTIILDDYASVRPEMMDRLEKLIRDKRILLVSWYTLPDMFLVGPESIVRNLLMGLQVAKPFGGAAKSGYTATSYGQTSQLPQIFSGFGIKSAVFYRGLNKHFPPSFMWKSKNGSKIRVFRCFDVVTRTNFYFFVQRPIVLQRKFCPEELKYIFKAKEKPVHLADEEFYELDFRLMKEDESFEKNKETYKAALEHIFEHTSWQSHGPHLLGLNMEDNQKPYSKLPELVKELDNFSDKMQIVQSTFDEFITDCTEAVPDSTLETRTGEMRYMAVEPGFNALFGTVTSSRVNLKLLNERSETKMTLLAEPIASCASMFDWRYPVSNMRRAWKSLLANHAHDSICGGAIDQAHRDMVYHFSETEMVAEHVIRRALEHIWQQIKVEGIGENDFSLTVFNTLPTERSEVVMAVLDIPSERKSDTDDRIHFDIFDSKGREVDYEILSVEKTNVRCENDLDTPAIEFKSDRHRILFKADAPAMGYSTYLVKIREPEYVKSPQPQPPRNFIATPNGCLENEYLKVTINPNGSFDLLDKENNKQYNNLHYFVDNGEVGTAWETYQPLRNFAVTSLGSAAKIIMRESNPLRGIFQIELTLEIPQAASTDKKDRLKGTVEIPISYTITLKKGSRRLDIQTTVLNKARDHKLSVQFPTDIKTDYVYAESAFAVEKRNILWLETKDNRESHKAYQPMQNFVDVTEGKVGFAFLGKGLREYEMLDDEHRCLSITLLRTHRAYMTASSVMTPEELDRIPGSHQLGELTFHYCLYPHKGSWQKGKVLTEAYNHKVSMPIVQGVVNEAGQLPMRHCFMTVKDGDRLMLSTMKQSEDGSGVILRLWNSTDESVTADINTTLPFKKVTKVQLDETAIEDLDFKNGSVEVKAKPAEIITLLFAR